MAKISSITREIFIGLKRSFNEQKIYALRADANALGGYLEKPLEKAIPTLAPVSLQSDALGQTFSLRITNAALRTLDFKGGLDVFLLNARDENLSVRARRIKRQLKAKQAAAQAAA